MIFGIRFYLNDEDDVCDGVINTGVYIGDDPVGHHCNNESEHQIKLFGNEYTVCERCFRFLIENDCLSDDLEKID